MPWHFNRQDGCYHYGHSYPMQKRVQVIATYLATLSTAITTEICQVSYNCVTKYVELFQQKATLSQIVSSNMHPRKIVWWMEAYFEALVRFYPTIYLRELQEILANDFRLGPHEVLSIAAIARLFTKLKITCRKCVHVTKERMLPHNRYCRHLYFQWRRTSDPSRVYFFDETHFNFETDERDYGRIDSGLACPSFREKGSRAVCVFTEGVMQAIPFAGTLTAELVTEIIENEVLPLLPHNSFLVADNASIHNEVALCCILARKNITLVKLPTYSYDLNPIELVFGLVKAIARFSPGFLRTNPMLAIINAFEQVRPINIRNLYKRSWGVFV